MMGEVLSGCALRAAGQLLDDLHTRVFVLAPEDRTNYASLLAALWPSLQWRHAGFGALQAYVREGDKNELRVHLWHPSLVKEGIAESGLCHDHRFNMRSNVIVGQIIQTEFALLPHSAGEYETWRVLHAREAMARGGAHHHDPVPTGDRYRRVPCETTVSAGAGYTFGKFAFHETRAVGTTITLVEKSAQEDVQARILAPFAKPIVHAFTETKPIEACGDVLADGLVALKDTRNE